MLVIFSAIAGLFFTAMQAYESKAINLATLREIREARSERAVIMYNTAVDPRTAPAARIKTLQFLVSAGETLFGIDLSCSKIGVMEENELGITECVGRPNLIGIDFSETTHGIQANLGVAKLIDVDFRRANLSGVRLSGAKLSGAQFTGADLRNADLRGADLSGANFTGARNTEYADFTGAWAWHDMPPVGLDVKITSCVFDSSGDNRLQSSNICRVLELKTVESK
ncbi:pentapeptide repeat-containing protein [Amylibacter sp. SFDW26]|nr:pentapeptide repeat-containing protein [Amylibacter sp. SFDW26]